MHVHAGVEVHVDLIAAMGTVEEFATFRFLPPPIKVGEPLPLDTLAGTVLACAVAVYHLPENKKRPHGK